MSKFSHKKGFHGFESDDAEFLKPSNTDPFKESASDSGYNSRWASGDNAGDSGRHGDLGIDDFHSNEEFMAGDASVQNMDQDYVHQKLNALIDNDPSLPSGKLNAGGGKLGRTGGVGPGKPRYAPKTGPHRTDGLTGGISRGGRR